MKKAQGPLIPREHGAWALLYGPVLVTVATLGSFDLSLLLFIVALTCLFLAHEPLAKLARSWGKRVDSRQRARWVNWLVVYITLMVAATAPLLFWYRRWLLIPLGGAIALLMVLHLVLIRQCSDRYLTAQLLGILALTASAPATWYVARGQLDSTALLLWVLNILYFSSGIFHVKMVVSRHVKTSLAPGRAAQSFLYHLLLLGVVTILAFEGLLPALLALAFAPVLVRAFWGLVSSPVELNLRRLGYTEVAYTAIFIFLAGAGLAASGV